MARQGAADIDKIIRGASPVGLPVEQFTEFELVIDAARPSALRTGLRGHKPSETVEKPHKMSLILSSADPNFLILRLPGADSRPRKEFFNSLKFLPNT